MKGAASSISPWIYRGLWGGLVRWLRVPEHPPSLPLPQGASESDRTQSHPSPDFLRYLRFWFWALLLPFDLIILVVWLIILSENPTLAYILAAPAFIIAVVPDIFVYVAIHVRYDATWYVLTPRAVRVRRGVWTIRECTATFENVQNISIRQGPVQRHFRIADLVIDTAGAASAGPKGASSSANQVVLEGLADAARIRDAIADRVRASKSAGLGDESRPARRASTDTAAPGFGPVHLQLLREIRDEARALARPS